jgi:hypothetical protein
MNFPIILGVIVYTCYRPSEVDHYRPTKYMCMHVSHATRGEAEDTEGTTHLGDRRLRTANILERSRMPTHLRSRERQKLPHAYKREMRARAWGA